MIGQAAPPQVFNLYPARPTIDYTRADYTFYGKLRRGKAQGYELGGLFAAAQAVIMNMWMLGDGVTITSENQAATDALKEFIGDNLQSLTEWNYDSLTLGDGFLAVNPDTTATLISPNQVEIEGNLFNPRQYEKIMVISQFNEPLRFTESMLNPSFQTSLTYGGTQTVTIRDIYSKTQRSVSIQRGALTPNITNYPNLIGELPIVHLPNMRESNEIFGHPVYENQLFLFSRYDNLINKSLDGVELMGNPIPAFEGLDDPAETMRLLSSGTRTIITEDGEQIEQPVIDFQSLSAIFLGSGGSFKFAQPGSFTSDTSTMLQLLFYLMLESSHIPEWTWGGAISSSMASVQAQAPAFTRIVKGWRSRLTPALLEACRLFLLYRGLSDPAVRNFGKLEASYPPPMPIDENLLTNKINQLRADNAITKETALRLMDLPGVSDPKKEVQDAEADAADAQASFDNAMEADIQKLATQPDEGADNAAA